MIRGLEHSAPAPVQRCRVVGRCQKSRFPAEPNVEIDRVLTLLRAKRRDGCGDIPRRRLQRITAKHGNRVFPLLICELPVRLVDLHPLAVGEIYAGQVARDRFGIDVRRARRIGDDVSDVAAGDARPVRIAQRTGLPATWAAESAVILTAAADVVRHGVVETDRVKLRQRQIHRREERSSAIERDGDPAVVRECDALGVLGIDPNAVCIGVRALLSQPRRLSAVDRQLHRRRREEKTIAVPRIDADLRIVEWTVVVVILLRPRAAGVSASIQPARNGMILRHVRPVRAGTRGLNERIDHIWIARRQPDANASLHARWESATGDFGPGRPAVDCLPQARSATAALDHVRRAAPFPARGVEHLWVPRIHRDIDEARAIANELRQRPGLPAVDRFVQASIRRRTVGGTNGGDVHNVGIRWVDDDTPDALSLL